MTDIQADGSSHPFLAGGGEMGRLVRAFPWESTPLGPIAVWPQSLRTAVGMVLLSPVPIVMLWGEDGVMIYNDAYSGFAGGRHPRLLGSKVREGWPEVADFNDNVMKVGLAGGTLAYRDQELTLYRHGRPEQVWMNLDYSPILDEMGRPAGVMAIVVETTERVLAERRIGAERERLRQMFEQAPGIMAMLRGPDYVFELANPAYMRLIGHRDVLGKPVREALPEIEGQGFLELLEKVYRTGETFVGREIRVLLQRVPGGPLEEAFLDFVYQPITDTTGAVTGIFVEGSDVTERKRADDDLRETSARLRLILESATDYAIITTDLDGVVTLWNPGARNLMGWSEDEMLGASVSLLFAPEDRAEGKPEYERRLATHRGRAENERWHLRKDGSRFWASGLVMPLKGSDGELLGFLKILRDRTEERQAEERLEARVAEALAERKVLADVVESTDAFVQIVDPDYRYLAINKASADEFERIFGIRPRVGDSMLDLLANQPEHQSAVKAVWSRALAGEAFTEIDEFGDPSLDRRYYEMKFSTLRDKDGKLIGAYQFVYDVTERLRAQARLAEAEARIRSIFETSYQYQGYLSPDGTVMDANRTSIEGIGARREDVVGRPFWETPWFSSTPGMAEAMKAAVRLAASGQTFRQEIHVSLPGGPRVFDFSMRPVRSASGGIIGIVPEAIDLTERKTAEEQVAQMQKMETIGQLTGGVAHDFNNLLTPIVGTLDMLRRRLDGKDERAQRLTAGALQAADRARTLIQRLLAFARRQHLEARPVDVHALIESMADLVSRSLGPRVRLVLDIAGDMPPARVDPNQFELALLNLAVNARDAMPDGGTLTISAREEKLARHSKLAPGRYVRISVQDEGIGMDVETLRRAVEPFFTTKGIGRGTGLGLSMVHGLAAQSGGDFALESAPGQGTTAIFRLPVADEAAVVLRKEVDGEISRPGIRAATVLLVDDEELVRTGTADMLTDAGYAVIEAESAVQALELVREGLVPDAVVTDYLMPGMTGAQLARELRGLRPALPVLMITGYATLSDREAGGLPRLAKPFRQAELTAHLAELLEGASGAFMKAQS